MRTLTSSSCNCSAGGRSHHRKCATVRESHSAVGAKGWRYNDRNAADPNHRPGQASKKEGSALGVRKPHPALRTGGRRRTNAGGNRS